MFEGWAADLLASYLGHFVDVKREALRIGLWSGLVLQDVQLRAEAFNCLGLPVKLCHGSIGRLQVRVPWGAFTLPNSYITIQLEDVLVQTALREDSDFGDSGSGDSHRGSEPAGVAAVEVLPSDPDIQESKVASSRGFAPLIEYVARLLLRRLKLSITNFRVQFIDESADGRSTGELFLDSLQTQEAGNHSHRQMSCTLPPPPRSALLVKELELQGLAFSWKHEAPSGQQSNGEQESPRDGANPFPLRALGHTAEDYVLQPVSAIFRASLVRHANSRDKQFSLAAQVSPLQLQVQDTTLLNLLSTSQRLDLWSRRSRYALFRPRRWPAAGRSESWRPVWHFVISAVRSELHTQRMSPVARSLRRQMLRKQYCELYRLRLERRGGAVSPRDSPWGMDGNDGEDDDEQQLAELEAKLPVSLVLLYRTAVERELEKASGESEESTERMRKSGYVRSWLGWGLSHASTYLGYLPVVEGHSAPSDEAIEELSSMIEQEEPSLLGDGLDPEARPSLDMALSVSSACVRIQQKARSGPPQDVASVEARAICASLSMDMDQNLKLDASIADAEVHDLCTDPGVSETIAWRLDATDSTHSNGFASTPVSGTVRNYNGSPGSQPLVRLSIEIKTRPESSSSSSRPPQPTLFVKVAPVSLIVRPTCLGRLAQIMAELPKIRGHTVMVSESSGRLETRVARTVARAELLMASAAPMAVDITMEGVCVLLPSHRMRTDSGILVRAVNVSVKMLQSLQKGEAKQMIQAARMDARPRRPRIPRSAAQASLEEKLLVDRVSVSGMSVEALMLSEGKEGSFLLEPASLHLSMSFAKLPPPVADIPVVSVTVNLPVLEARLPMQAVKGIMAVGKTMDVLQELMPPPPMIDSCLPVEARVGHMALTMTLAGLELRIEDQLKTSHASLPAPYLLMKLSRTELSLAGAPHDCVILKIRQLELMDERSVFRGSSILKFPSLASYVSLGPIAVNVDARYEEIKRTDVSLAGIIWSGYSGQESNFIQMCNKNPNLPSVAVSVLEQDNGVRRETATTVKVANACVGADLVTSLVKAMLQIQQLLDDLDGNEAQAETDPSQDPPAHELGPAEQQQESDSQVTRLSVEVTKCQLAVNSWDSIESKGRHTPSTSATPLSRPITLQPPAANQPQSLLLDIPLFAFSLPTLQGPVTGSEPAQILRVQGVGLYVCTAGLQPLFPALVSVPEVLAVQEACEPSSDESSSISAVSLSADLGAVEATIGLKAVPVVARIVFSRMQQAEEIVQQFQSMHPTSGGRAPILQSSAPAIAATLRVSLAQATAKLVDEHDADVVLVALQDVLVTGDATTGANGPDMTINVSASLLGLNVVSLTPAPSPGSTDGRDTPLNLTVGAFGSQQSLHLFSKSASGSSIGEGDRAQDPFWGQRNRLPQRAQDSTDGLIFHIDPSNASDLGGPHANSSGLFGQGDGGSVSLPPSAELEPPAETASSGGRTDSIPACSEDDDIFQDAPEDFLSPSSSLKSDQQISALMSAWAKRELQTLRLAREAPQLGKADLQEILDSNPLLFSFGGADGSTQQLLAPSSSAGATLEMTAKLHRPCTEDTQHQPEDNQHPQLAADVCISISGVHATAATCGWDEPVQTLQRLVAIIELHSAANTKNAEQEPKQKERPEKQRKFTGKKLPLALAASLATSKAVVLARPFLRRSPLAGFTTEALPLLSFGFGLSASATVEEMSSPLSSAALQLHVAKLEVTPMVVVPSPVSPGALALDLPGPGESAALRLIDSGVLGSLSNLEVRVGVGSGISLHVGVDSVSSWVSHGRLRMLLAALADMQEGAALYQSAHGSLNGRARTVDTVTSANNAMQQLVELFGIQEGKPLALDVGLQVGALTCSISEDSANKSIPLLDVWVQDVSGSLSSKLGSMDDMMNSTLSATVTAEAYSAEKKDWESVLEPWTVRAEVLVSQPLGNWLHTRAADSAPTGQHASSSPSVVLVSVTAEELMQVTFGTGIADVAAGVIDTLQKSTAWQGARSATNIKRLMQEMAENKTPAGAYQVTNLTGCAVTCRPVSKTATARTPSGSKGAEATAVSPSKRPVSAAMEERAHGPPQDGQAPQTGRFDAARVVGPGCSAVLKGKQSPVSPVSPGDSLSRARSSPARAQPADDARYSFQLENQTGPCAPLSLEAVGVHFLHAMLSVDGHDVQTSLVAETERVPHAGRSVTIHSRVQVANHCSTSVEIAIVSSTPGEPISLGILEHDTFMWLPVRYAETALLRIRPFHPLQGGDVWDWCDDVDISLVIRRAAAGSSNTAGNRKMLCPSTSPAFPSFHVCLGPEAVHIGGVRCGWTIKLEPALVVHNCLPVPASLELLAAKVDSGTSLSVGLIRAPHPQLKVAVTDTQVPVGGGFKLHVQGYLSSRQAELPLVPCVDAATDPHSQAWLPSIVKEDVKWGDDQRVVHLTPFGSDNARDVDRSFMAAVQLELGRSRTTGAVHIRIFCDLWVYNCTGIPLALRYSEHQLAAPEGLAPAAHDAWVAPFRPIGLPEPEPSVVSDGAAVSVGTPSEASAAPARSPFSAGFGAALTPVSPSPLVPPSANPELSPVVLATSRLQTPTATRATPSDAESSLGLGPILASSSAFTPSPGMVSKAEVRWTEEDTADAQSAAAQLLVQLCAEDVRDGVWSQPVELGGLGAAATAVIRTDFGARRTRAGYYQSPAYMQVALASVPIMGAGSARALHVFPQHVLYNGLAVPLLWRQAPSSQNVKTHELPPGQSSALFWEEMPEGSVPEVSVRVHEASWDWSSPFAVNSPGDVFVKLRHPIRGQTLLVGVDVAAAPGGCWVTSLTSDAEGFAPYRLDNCSPYTLHCRQEGCNVSADVLRPYCSLPYAWDQPAAARALVVELPGGHALGCFRLDQVGQTTQRSVAVGKGGGVTDVLHREVVQIAIRAEGPTCVLQITDLKRHQPIRDRQLRSRAKEIPAGRHANSSASAPGDGTETEAIQTSPHLRCEFTVNLAGFGLSVVTDTSDLLYVCIEDIRTQASSGWANNTVTLDIGAIQVDNQLPNALYPVLLCSPVRRLRMGGLCRARACHNPEASSVSARSPGGSGSASEPRALSVQLSLWRRRPGGVICVESFGIRGGGIALQLDELHLTSTVEFLLEALAPYMSRLGESPVAQVAISGTAHVPDPRLLALVNNVKLPSGDSGLSWATEQAAEQMVYIEHLVIHPIQLTISFASAPPSTATSTPELPFQRLTYLADMEGAQLNIKKLELWNPLLRANALIALVSQHYSQELLPALIRLIGTIGIIGDPIRNIHYVGLGVLQFVAGPASGFVQSVRGHGPRRFAQGLVEGTAALVTNTLFAASNATTKFSAAARKGLEAMGWAPDAPRGRAAQASPGSSAAGPADRDKGTTAEPQASLISAVMRGVAGLVSEPIRGLDQGGLRGLAGGIVSGAAGVVGHPAAEILQISERIASSVRRLVSGSPAELPRSRLPRHVSPASPIRPYDRLEAIGYTLLPVVLTSDARLLVRCVELVPTTGEDDEARREGTGGGSFQTVRTAMSSIASANDAETRYAVLSRDRLGAVRVVGPEVRPDAATVMWTVDVRDMLMVTREGSALRLILLSAAGDGWRAAAVGRDTSPRPATSPPASSPVIQRGIQCVNEQDAVALELELASMMPGDAGHVRRHDGAFVDPRRRSSGHRVQSSAQSEGCDNTMTSSS